MKAALAAGGVALLLLAVPLALAETPAAADQKAERAELFIGLLKRRAQRILEARRAPPPPPLSVSAGIAEGYESNVNLDGTRQGDLLTEESAAAAAGRALTTWLKGEVRWDLVHTHYQELTDSNLWMNTFGAVAQLQPIRAVRMDLKYEYGILNFPRDADSSFADHRVKAALLVAQTAWLTHKIHWTYQAREYDTRKARDGGGTSIVGANRQDDRHTAGYELQVRFPKTVVRVGAEAYRNFSNEQFQDFYDWDDVKARVALTRILAPDWVATLMASHESRHYHRRSVPAIAVAEQDALITVAGTLNYQLTAHTSATASVTYRHQDSNDPRLDFTDWLTQVGMTLSF